MYVEYVSNNSGGDWWKPLAPGSCWLPGCPNPSKTTGMCSPCWTYLMEGMTYRLDNVRRWTEVQREASGRKKRQRVKLPKKRARVYLDWVAQELGIRS